MQIAGTNFFTMIRSYTI